MQLLNRCIICLTVAVICYPVCAAISQPSGLYLDANGGSSTLSNYYNGSSTTATDTSNNKLGWNINIGYKFSPFLAAEIGYTSYTDAQINNAAGTKAATIQSRHVYDLAGKGILPLGHSGFELFGKLGISRGHVQVIDVDSLASASNILTGSKSRNGGYIALGGDYAIATYLTANVQWSRNKGGQNTTGDADLYSLGLTYYPS